MSHFLPPRAKLTIGSLEPEGSELFVRAQYNPKELQVDRPVPWVDHPGLAAEYKGRAPRTTTLELLFDGYEDRTFSVPSQIDKLERLALPRDADSPQEAMRRPHRCVVVWGEHGAPAMRCVIESLSVKYTVFHEDGLPLRATCSLKVREIDIRHMWKERESLGETRVLSRQRGLERE